MIMENTKYYFNGTRFEYPEDFEKVLRPTKWSIRMFLTFMRSLDIIDRSRFIDHVLEMLPDYFTDKDTANFVLEIKKRTTYYPVDRDPSIQVVFNRENELINTFAAMKKNGIITASATALANLLKNQFGVKYSIPTIRDKIYRFIGEI